MILPLRVRGRSMLKGISLGATAGPRRFRAWRSSSRARGLTRFEARLQGDEGFHDLAGHRVGLADDPCFGDAGCSISALWTSNRPIIIRWPADLITSPPADDGIFGSYRGCCDIPNGATLGFGGFQVVGMPINLYGAVAMQGARNLTCASNSTRGDATLPADAPDMGQII
jgi:hypothetical protein